MRAQTFWKTVVADKTDFLDHLIALFAEHGVRYCLIGGQAVNAYVEPLVSLDLDIIVAVDQLSTVEALAREQFTVEEFPHSLNISQPGSDLRVQIQTDPRYASFVDRATVRSVLGIPFPVAALEDLLQGKVWAATDATRRPSKRRKDLLDIERLIESYPHLRDRTPPDILAQLE
ncbi:MAG: hypothetical protein ACRDJE_14955 [Dehalococcoidia bacterium]